MGKKKNEILGESYVVPTDGLKETKPEQENSLDEDVRKLDVDIASKRQIEYESDRGYHKIAAQIVEISEKYLSNQCDNKAPLRDKFVKTFGDLIKWQFGVLAVFLFLNSCEIIPFKMSEYLLTTYIVSVFVETLGLIGVMIGFSFASKEESNIVEVLTTVIQNYQKYDSNQRKKTDDRDKNVN